MNVSPKPPSRSGQIQADRAPVATHFGHARPTLCLG
jgi:hypothetical protein